MQLRSAVLSELTSIEALLRVSGLPTSGAEEFLSNFIVAADNSDVVACGGIEYHGNFALIRSIAVAEYARGSGLGKTIVSRLLTECRNHSVQSVALLTTTAERFFIGHGFKRVARHEVPESLLVSSQFQGICPVSATTMLKTL